MRKAVCCLLLALPLLAQSNPELARIFNEDQKDRADWQHLTPAARESMVRQDALRRTRVTVLLKSGALKTGEDYERAAFIFQHGSEPADYLLAHVLAMTAHALDAGRGIWIAAATLDRYLANTGKAQVFGTQLTDTAPFQRDFVPDSVRAANCVPSVAERERMMQALAKDQPLPAIAPCAPQPEKLAGSWSITEQQPGGGFAHSLLVFRGPDDDRDDTLAENGETRTIDQMTMADRELRFRVRDREYVFTLDTDVMHGTVNRPGGDQRLVVALRAR
jgi:hypothetical protein